MKSPATGTWRRNETPSWCALSADQRAASDAVSVAVVDRGKQRSRGLRVELRGLRYRVQGVEAALVMRDLAAVVERVLFMISSAPGDT